MKPFQILCGLILATSVAKAAEPASKESDYYKITTFETPKATVIAAGNSQPASRSLPPGYDSSLDPTLEVSSMIMLPNNRIALGTRRGEIWIVSNATDPEASNVRYQCFAQGQHEIMGLAYKDGWIYETNRYEVARLKDENGDGRANVFETVSDKWGVSGDYHEYAWGSEFDKHGDLWVLLCLTGSFTSEAPFRGWALRVKPDGSTVPTCSGIRSPGGLGFDADGEVYYTDNQGPWRGADNLQHLVPGTFQGNPSGNKWYSIAPNMGPRPLDPNTPSRLDTERARIKEFVPPACYLVYGTIGQSSSFIACDLSNGKWGPFQKQLFIGDQSHSNVCRVYLEEVNGVKQGVVYPFLSGFKSGLIAGRMDDKTGQLFVGGSDRGWGARGGRPYCFERVDWTGKVPFEIDEMHAKPDGFELTFTQPIDPKTAADPASYKWREFTYIYRAEYGSPEVDDFFPKVTNITVAPDNKSVRFTLDKLTKGDIHEVHVEGLRSADGIPILHPLAYYTLNEIPVK